MWGSDLGGVESLGYGIRASGLVGLLKKSLLLLYPSPTHELL